ncbi:YicC/YloC family endoribonuclease [Clostridium sp. Ade.TY]|uniref:YicC/YloC family endoribonuclease n=1 Tax=Clostridium sp. Ade.TY TaxID=1391647 RepID=UPI0003F9246D|nr:YicC/YloC family endoribonuclease [Clostridium sp. Ade.TY]
MVKSMTSFGRARSEEGLERIFSIEMKSVNHRYLDMNIRMPKSMFQLEEKFRKIISGKLNRGKVDVYINIKNFHKGEAIAELNETLAKSYFECLQKLSDELGVLNDITATKIARFPDVISIVEKEENIEEIFSEIKSLIESALDKMVEMRIREGEKLKEDILEKLIIIENLVDSIEKIADLVPVEYKSKLEDRIKDLTSGIEIDKNRIAVEIAIFADKATVDEEIIRLRSHIGQMRNTLELDEPIGRKLDFIVQEMNREANTIASKSNDMKMTNIVIDIKNLIEKIREQVQNIE